MKELGTSDARPRTESPSADAHDVDMQPVHDDLAQLRSLNVGSLFNHNYRCNVTIKLHIGVLTEQIGLQQVM